MRRTPLFLLILVIAGYAAQAQVDSFPSYETVYRRFFAAWSVDSLDIGGKYLLHFARKPRGWYIQVENINTRGITLEQRFWENSGNSWRPLDGYFPPVKKPMESQRLISQYESDSAYYALNLFFGYTGWETDVIGTLGTLKSRMNERQFYQFSRAYLSLATWTIWPELRQQNAFLKIDSTLDAADLPSSTVSAFIRFADSAVLLQKQLMDADPRFPTLTGDIGDDYANTCMTAYYLLRIAGQDAEARKYLCAGLYDEFTLNYYRNMLVGCDSATVLFSVGDDDTYVPQYLQEREGLRRDITVVLANFLDEGRYLKYITRRLPPEHRLTTTLPLYLYTPGHVPWHYVVKGDLESSNALDFVRTVSLHWENKVLEDGMVADKPVWLTFPIQAGRAKGKLFSWTLAGGQYLLKSDVFFTDFFATNGFKRPVAFVAPRFGLDSHCHLSGLLNQVFSDSADQATVTGASRKTAADMLNRFTYSGLDSLTANNAAAVKYRDWYRYDFSIVAMQLIDAGEKRTAAAVVDRFWAVFLNRFAALNVGSLSTIQFYYYANEPGKGDSLIRVLIDGLALNVDAVTDPARQKEVSRMDLEALNYLLSMLDNFGRTGEVHAAVVDARNKLSMKLGLQNP